MELNARNQDYRDQDSVNMQNEFPKGSNRNLNQEFARNAHPNKIYQDNYNSNENRSYYSDEELPPNLQNQQNILNNQMNRGQNMGRYPQSDFQSNQPNIRQSRFNELSHGQQQYLMDLQRQQDQRNYQQNQNLSNSYYDMGNRNTKRQHPNNLQMNSYIDTPQQFPYPDGGTDPQMYYNTQAQYIHPQFGEVSFVKEQNPNQMNIVSGPSTDRFSKSRNPGLPNYMSAGHGSSNAPNSTPYNSQPGGGPQEQVMTPMHQQVMNKEYLANPPTFHPYHHLQNSSHINNQNTTQTPSHMSYMMGHPSNSKMLESQTRDSLQAMPGELHSLQITPKPTPGQKYQNYDSQYQSNYQYPGSREDSRG